MAKVNLQELKAKEEKDQAKKLLTEIQEQVIGGVKCFKGPSLEDWFDDYGECILANSEAKRQAEYKRSGLDEFGRTREQAGLSKAKAELLAKKAALVAEIKKIDLEIQQLRAEQFSEKAEKHEKKEEKKGKK